MQIQYSNNSSIRSFAYSNYNYITEKINAMSHICSSTCILPYLTSSNQDPQLTTMWLRATYVHTPFEQFFSKVLDIAQFIIITKTANIISHIYNTTCILPHLRFCHPSPQLTPMRLRATYVHTLSQHFLNKDLRIGFLQHNYQKYQYHILYLQYYRHIPNLASRQPRSLA